MKSRGFGKRRARFMHTPACGKFKRPFQNAATKAPAPTRRVTETTDGIAGLRVGAEGERRKATSGNPKDAHIAVTFGGQNLFHGKYAPVGVRSKHAAFQQIPWRFGDVITGNCRALVRDEETARQIQVLVGTLIASVAPAHAQMAFASPLPHLFRVKMYFRRGRKFQPAECPLQLLPYRYRIRTSIGFLQFRDCGGDTIVLVVRSNLKFPCYAVQCMPDGHAHRGNPTHQVEPGLF